MSRDLLHFAAGLLFALGLGLSQMTRPDVVLGFLDVANFNPTLLFVMGGAIAVHAVPTWLILNRGAPVLGENLHLPTRTQIDAPLIGGAVLFGVGWGLAGYCPGPALVTASAGSSQGVLLFLGMIGGMGAVQLTQRWSATRNQVREHHAPPTPTDRAIRGL